MKIFSLLLLIIVTNARLLCAQPDNTLHVSGKILDENSKAVAYVNLHLAGDPSLGTYSNASGQFMLLLPGSSVADSIVFSCVGFESLAVPVKSLLYSKDSVFIKLISKTYTLQAVTISPDTALSIVRKSVQRLQDNLSNNKNILQGFFREIIRSDYTYDRLIEAAIDVFDNGYKPKDDSELKFKVREIRKSEDYRDLDWELAILNYVQPKNGLHGHFESLFTNDYIRNNENFYSLLVNAPLNEEFFQDVTFSLDSSIYYGTDRVLCIGIQPKADAIGLFPHGILYIREKDFAILEMQYEVEVSADSEIPFAIPGQKNMHSTVIKYQEYNGKFYLSFLHRKSFRFEMNSSKYDKSMKEAGKKEGHFYHELLFVTNEIITEKHKLQSFRRKERQRSNEDLYSTRWKYNADFWKGYNVVNERPLEPSIVKDIEREASLNDQFKKSN